MEFSTRGRDGEHVVGYAHLGACLASRWLYETLRPVLERELAAYPGWALQLTGHSIGGACVSMVSMMIHEAYADPAVCQERGISEAVRKEMAGVQCLTIACPPCLSENLSLACREYVLAVMNNGDVVPLLSLSNGHRLLSEVDRMPWRIAKLKSCLFCPCAAPARQASSRSGPASTAPPKPASSGSSRLGRAGAPDRVPYIPELYPAGRVLHMVPAKTWDAVQARGTAAVGAAGPRRHALAHGERRSGRMAACGLQP